MSEREDERRDALFSHRGLGLVMSAVGPGGSGERILQLRPNDFRRVFGYEREG